MRIAFIGFGLVAGSVARALRRLPPAEVPSRADATSDAEDSRSIHRPWVVAWSPSGEGPRTAVADGVIDEAAAGIRAALDAADLVVLAGPADTVLALVPRLALGGDLRAVLGDGATITDVASTKSAIMHAADAAELPFVGGHPMAGRESRGYGASDEAMLSGRPWVIVRGASARAMDAERVQWLARSVGAEPVLATATEHDRAVAAVSHLPLVVAAALAETVAGDDAWPHSLARALSATGWQSSTRLARGDPAMGAGILATNAAATRDQLRSFRAVLDGWITALDSAEAPDSGTLQERLERARASLDR
jgi:prephenate dehydrogenase